MQYLAQVVGFRSLAWFDVRNFCDVNVFRCGFLCLKFYYDAELVDLPPCEFLELKLRLCSQDFALQSLEQSLVVKFQIYGDLLIFSAQVRVKARFWRFPLKHQRIQISYLVVFVGVSKANSIPEPNVAAYWVKVSLLK